MKYAIPSAILVSLLALGACSSPRYGNSANTGFKETTVTNSTLGPADAKNNPGEATGAPPAKAPAGTAP